MGKILEIATPIVRRMLELAGAVAGGVCKAAGGLIAAGAKKAAAAVGGKGLQRAQPVIKSVLIISCCVAVVSGVCLALARRR